MFALFGNRQERPTHEALLMGALEAPSGTSAVVHKSWLGRVVDDVGRGRLARIVAGGATFVAVVAFALFFLLGKDEKAARQGATKFAAALVHNSPSSAPPGATRYVGGGRAHLGPVRRGRRGPAHHHR